MIYPGSFIWKRIGDDWLVSKRASALFAASSVLIAAVTVFFLSNLEFQSPGLIGSAFLGLAGFLCAISIPFLWGGMWRYWMSGKPSNRGARRIWFLFLLGGMWYGAVLYFLFVYLPGNAIRNKEQSAGGNI